MKQINAFNVVRTYLGGIPTTKPDPIFVGEALKERIERDKEDEEVTTNLYNQRMETAQKERDITTARLLRKTLEDEEEHHDLFAGLLEVYKI